MRHTYRCQLRWGDMDQLGHVNNVAYFDYLQEARVALLRAAGVRAEADGSGGVREAMVVVRHRATFVAPLVHGPDPVEVDVWVSDVRAATVTVSYEIRAVGADGSPRTCMRAATLLAPYDLVSGTPRRVTAAQREAFGRLRDEGGEGGETAGGRGHPLARALPALPGPREGDGVAAMDLHPRFSDVDGYGHVNNVAQVFWIQEARVALLDELWDRAPTRGAADLSVVLGQLDVDYLEPALGREEPYRLRTAVSALGRSSFTLDGEITDPLAAGAPVARSRAALIAFDPVTQRASSMPQRYREPLSSKVLTMN